MDRKIGKRLSYLMNHHQAYANAKLKELNLTYAQANVMVILKKYNYLTQEELGRKMLLDKARISRLIKQLEEKQLICKVLSQSDRRSFHISLSENGENIIERIVVILHESSEQMLLNVNDKEVEQLLQILDRLCMNVSKGGLYYNE